MLDADGKPKTDADGNPVLAADPRYFQPRPSTATSYNAAGDRVHQPRAEQQGRARHVRGEPQRPTCSSKAATPGLTSARVPVDAVTSSASGVDPHISPANAAIQAHRVAAVRRLPLAQVQTLIDDHTDGRSLGVLGEPGVNVLELNLALDDLAPDDRHRTPDRAAASR